MNFHRMFILEQRCFSQHLLEKALTICGCLFGLVLDTIKSHGPGSVREKISRSVCVCACVCVHVCVFVTYLVKKQSLKTCYYMFLTMSKGPVSLESLKF